MTDPSRDRLDASDRSDFATQRLVDAARELAAARDLQAVVAAVRRSARAVSGADGVTFVLREGDLVHYVDEDAIGPLWKGRRFPATACISGWAMLRRETVVIEDVYLDDRIPHDAYRPTFVKSLMMAPVVSDEAVAAIGAYWAASHRPTGREVRAFESLAGLASVALVNAKLDGELRAAIRLRDEFIAIASHELRSPVSAAQMQMALATRAMDGAPEAARARHAVERARRSTARLARLVQDLLDVSRLAHRNPVLDREPVLLSNVVRAVADRVRDSSPAAQVQVAIAGEPCGSWDRARIERAVENLLVNAVKFGGEAPVEVAVALDGREAVLSVRDHGIGIAPEDHARIFEPFERAVSTRHFGGFGLGLWIVRDIVAAHGGTITVDSRPGAGATFVVRLPLAPAA